MGRVLTVVSILFFVFGLFLGAVVVASFLPIAKAQTCQTITGTIETNNPLSSHPNYNVNLKVCQ